MILSEVKLSTDEIVYPETIVYPESDGKPMGETDWHIAALLYLRQALRYFFREQQVYVAADLLFYYEQDEPSTFKVPDAFVVKNISPHDRRVYKLWEEGKPPDVIFEITSKSTRWDDLTTKKALYEYLGVQEYILFDPLDEYLNPRLQAFELVKGQYQTIELDESGHALSNELGLYVKSEGHLLRLLDPATGEAIPTLYEAAARAEEEAARAERAEAENAQLRAELAKLRPSQNS